MVAPNQNTRWADIFVDELARAGLQSACIAPGSRSTPLTVAFAKHPKIRVYSLLDERGAAFFALGMALVSKIPTALVCTSGTAAANFYPAIIEADSAAVPLLALTTDRPHELRHSGSNQTIDQVKMYGNHARWFVDVALPQANPPEIALRSLRTLANRAVSATMGLPPGPVHLNFPFRKPLEPAPVAGDAPKQLNHLPPKNNKPFTKISRGVVSPPAEQLDLLTKAIQNAARGMIVCGPRCPGRDFPAAVTQLARTSGFPIFADALSGVRFGPHVEPANSLILSGYETFLQREVVAGWAAPDLILRFGAMPISNRLGLYLGANHNSRRIVINGNGLWQDDTHTSTDLIWADPAVTCTAVTNRLASGAGHSNDEAWVNRLIHAEAETWEIVDSAQEKEFFEGVILFDILQLIPHKSTLFVSNSLPVRHLDQFSSPHLSKIRVLANRGASGIDGTIASALGSAAATDEPLVLVIGDLSFYHDMNSLLAMKRCGINITIVLINNNGGGIFRRLPIANFDPPFTDLFLTPHNLDFEPVARMFGTGFVRTANRDTFRRIFRESAGSNTSRIIEVTTDSALHEKTRREIVSRVVEKLTQ